jgi:hypothetical protein
MIAAQQFHGYSSTLLLISIIIMEIYSVLFVHTLCCDCDCDCDCDTILLFYSRQFRLVQDSDNRVLWMLSFPSHNYHHLVDIKALLDEVIVQF